MNSLIKYSDWLLQRNNSAFVKSVKYFLWLIPVLFLAVFYFYPFLNIIYISFTEYSDNLLVSIIGVFSSPGVYKTIAFTFYQAFLSTILTLILGMPAAYVFARFDFRGKNLLRTITGLPFVMPTLVVAAAFNSLIGTKGLVNVFIMRLLGLDKPFINLSHSLAIILIAHVFYNTTIVVRIVGDYWSRMSENLLNAARVLGANWFQGITKITIPLLSPSIIAASLLVFLFDFTSFGVILVLGGAKFSTIEVEIYYQTVSLFNLPVAAILSILQLMFTLILTFVYSRLSERITRPIELVYTPKKPSKGSKIIVTVVLVLLVVFTALPLLSLVFQSVLPSITKLDSRFYITLDYYRELAVNHYQSISFVPPTTAIFISLAYAFVTVIFSMGIGVPTAYLLSRSRDSFTKKVLDPLVMLPIGTSAVTMGLGFLVSFNKPPFNLYSSPLLIPIAHTMVAFPFVVRILAPAFGSIKLRLIEAARVLGADAFATFRYVEFPIIGKAFLVSSLFAFTISMGEFGATSLLYRPEYPTMPILIYRYLSKPGAMNYGKAMALSTILMALVFVSMTLIDKFRLKGVSEF